MNFITALGTTTGILCGIWVWGTLFFDASGLYITTWGGFAGCTTYFACGKKGLEGLKHTIIPNMSGIFSAMVIFKLMEFAPFPGSTAVWPGLIVFVMCIQSRFTYLAFIPGTFIGAFSTFAAAGAWEIAVPSLLLGALLGIACERSGSWLYTLVGKAEEKLESTD